MNIKDYFIKACQDRAYHHKDWVISAFSVTRYDPDHTPCPYEIKHDNDGVYYFDPTDQTWITLDGAPSGAAALNAWNAIHLPQGTLDNVDRDVDTTYGNVLANCVVLIYPFKDKIPFIVGHFDIGKVEKEIARRLTTDGKTPRKGITNPIYTSEYLKFIDAALALTGYTQLWVPSATRKTLTRDPRIPELRAKLMEQYKDSLDDPATIAIIEGELKKVDREWMKGDRGEGFYHKAKAYNVVRKKMFLTHGAEAAFQEDTSKVTFIPNSLSEGWDVDKLPEMNNSSREGSYNRGALTALGGESAKTLTRMMQNTRITEEDCGTRLGMDKTITEKNAALFVGFFYLKGNTTHEITEENYRSLVGQTLTIRTPLYCKTGRPNFCVACMGQSNARNPTGVSALISAVGSKFMTIRMGKMHGTALETARYEVDDCLV